jgi:hypothetical protein
MPSALKSRLAALERLTGRAWRCATVFYHTPKGTRVFVDGREMQARDAAEMSESERAAAEKRQRGMVVKVYIDIDPEWI